MSKQFRDVTQADAANALTFCEGEQPCQPVYDGVLPSWPILAGGSVIALFTLILGWLVFSSRADEFTYRT